MSIDNHSRESIFNQNYLEQTNGDTRLVFHNETCRRYAKDEHHFVMRRFNLS